MFGKRPSKPPENPFSETRNRQESRPSHTIQRPQRREPEYFAKIIYLNAKDVISHPLEDGRRSVHIETMLCALGAMAGFGCQVSVYEGLVAGGLISARDAFLIVKTNDGGTYLFGDHLNSSLVDGTKSVWGYVGGALQSLGQPLIDMHEIADFVTRSVGSPSFGTLRVSAEHQPILSPIEGLKGYWSYFYKMLQLENGDPMLTGVYFGIAAHLFIIEAKDILSPEIAARIVMESAIAMSKIDPKLIVLEI